MVSSLGQWLIVGLCVGLFIRQLRHWTWGTALLSGIGAAFLLLFALSVLAAYTT